MKLINSENDLESYIMNTDNSILKKDGLLIRGVKISQVYLCQEGRSDIITFEFRDYELNNFIINDVTHITIYELKHNFINYKAFLQVNRYKKYFINEIKGNPIYADKKVIVDVAIIGKTVQCPELIDVLQDYPTFSVYTYKEENNKVSFNLSHNNLPNNGINFNNIYDKARRKGFSVVGN
jgi:hypothetical protein